MPDTKPCPYCGEIIKETAVKCRYCGEWLNENKTVSPSTDHFTFVRLALASRYELKEEIGKGGMAVVYKAIQKNLERQVALKVLSPQSTLDKEFIERFHREARTAAKLKHSNIVTIYDEGIESGVHFIAMEYLEGIDLNSLIRKKGFLSVEETVSIIVPIAKAIDYAHQSGIIHRDIKSANIFITNSKRSILTDFGIAHGTVGTQLTVSGSVLGTPEFMSPEQADGRTIDNRSDIYSLGVVMYHALVGRLPYQGENPLTIIYKLINEPHTPLAKIKNLPEWLERSVEACLIKDPNNRIQSGEELADLLEKRKVSHRKSTASHSATVRIDKQNFTEIGAQDHLRTYQQKEIKIPKPHLEESFKSSDRQEVSSKISKFILASIVLLISILIYYLVSNSDSNTQMIQIEKPVPNVIQQTPSEPPVQQPAVIPEQNQQNESTNIAKEEKQIEQKFDVPYLIGLSSEAAKAILRSSGLKLGATFKIANTPENVNIVIKQIPKPGENVARGTPITITVGE